MAEGAQAAPPLLGSTLLKLAENEDGRRPSPASCGCAAIDQMALEGGFRYGEITSIAGAAGTGKTLLVYHAAASHLLSHASAEVAFIDNTVSFSPVRLRDVLVFRLSARAQRERFVQTGYVYERRSADGCSNDEKIMQEATSMLDRIKVMRVFDLAGIAEAVGEVAEIIEKEPLVCDTEVEATARLMESKEIGDSEDELEDEHSFQTKARTDEEPYSAVPRIRMIIIDTITNVVSSTVAKNQLQGQALLAALMRSLNQITSRHHICTLLTNAAVGMSPSKNPEYQHRPEDHVSIFTSNLGKPALSRSFTHFIDTALFLAVVPKTKNDAIRAYGDRESVQKWRSAAVLEVLKDRNGAREGRWAAFEIASNVKLVPC